MDFYKSVFVIYLINILPCNVCVCVCVCICYCDKRLFAAAIWFKFKQHVNDCRFVLKCTCQGVCCGYAELFLVILESYSQGYLYVLLSQLTNKNTSVTDKSER
jgi:hypothetical protein